MRYSLVALLLIGSFLPSWAEQDTTCQTASLKLLEPVASPLSDKDLQLIIGSGIFPEGLRRATNYVLRITVDPSNPNIGIERRIFYMASLMLALRSRAISCRQVILRDGNPAWVGTGGHIQVIRRDTGKVYRGDLPFRKDARGRISAEEWEPDYEKLKLLQVREEQPEKKQSLD